MTETLFALTNDDAGGHSPELFAQLLDFLRDEAVCATFFVIPFWQDRPLHASAEWIDLLQRALAEGHELQHHAYRHDSCFEFGVPPYFMLDIMPDALQRYQESPESFAEHHRYATLRQYMEHGREILQQTLGYIPRGFRAPCLGVCEAQYHALADLEFSWVTNQVINPLGWRYINHAYATGETWHDQMPTRPYRHATGVVEVPMHSEYTWYLTPQDVDRHTALAVADLDRATQRNEPFVALSHYYAMTGEWHTGLDVYRRLFAHARAKGDVRFATVSELVDSESNTLSPTTSPTTR